MFITTDWYLKKSKTYINFKFELDEFDSEFGHSSHAGKNLEIKLNGNSCTFIIPIEIDKPHKDILAFIALKIISPYIGKNFIFEDGVSLKFSELIKNEFQTFDFVLIDYNLLPFEKDNLSNPVISFSGGWDSLALSAITENNIPLVTLAKLKRVNNVPRKIRSLKSYNINPKIINKLKTSKNKYVIWSDFQYLSSTVNNEELWYPTGYAYIVGALLLLDKFHFSEIMTGDIFEAFTSNNKKYNENFYINHNNFFKDFGFPIVWPLMGVSEWITSEIVLQNNLGKIPSTCEISYKSPCMKCVKCFRKNLYKWSITGKKPKKWNDRKFTNGGLIDFLLNDEYESNSFMPNYKEIFMNIDHNFTGIVNEVKNKAISSNLNSSFIRKIYTKPYNLYDKNGSITKIVKELKLYATTYDQNDLLEFHKLNCIENFKRN